MNSSITRQVSGSPRVALGQGLHIFVLIDALGWEFIKAREFLDAELPFRTPLKTVLGFSSGAIPTILTGLRPAQTGHWNLFYFDPEGSPFWWLRWVSLLPDRLVDNRYSRKIVKELGRRILGLGPLFECGVSPRILPWLNWVEKENIYTAGGIPGSHSIFDLLRERGIPHRVYSYHDLSDAQIVEHACSDITSSNARFFFLYLSEVDHFLHGQCNDAAEVTRRLNWYQDQLRQILALAIQRDPQATFTVISDHGMTPVRSEYDLVSRIRRLGFKMPNQYLAVYDSTMARYWFFDEATRESIQAELARIPCGRILDDAELDRLGILFSDRRYGEIVFLLDPGWIVGESDFKGNGWNPVGMHGYHPSDPYSDAIFLSNRQTEVRMFSIGDIFHCMEAAARS
jgi:hypothetical protein